MQGYDCYMAHLKQQFCITIGEAIPSPSLKIFALIRTAAFVFMFPFILTSLQHALQKIICIQMTDQ